MKLIIKLLVLIRRYNLIILGAIIFIIYFWNRFLRSRTSKDLPLDLTVLRFFILVNLCIIFMYICISLLFPRKHNELIEKIIAWLFIPIMEFDRYLKSFTTIKTLLDKLYIKSYPLLNYLIIETNLFFIIFWIFPRLILLTALFVDVFIFHKLHYKYLVIFFGLLLFFNRYFKFSLKNSKKDLIDYYKLYIDTITTNYVPKIHPAELAPDYDPNDPDEEEYSETMALPFETFIEFQVNSMVYQNITRNISFIYVNLALSKIFWKQYFNLDDNPSEKYLKIPYNYENENFIFTKKKEFAKHGIKEIINVSLLLEFYNKNTNQNNRIKNIKVLIYLNYLICWLYVLIISLPTLNVNELMYTINNTWLLLENPFV